MKRILVFYPLTIVFVIALLFAGCKKEDTANLPVINTTSISNIAVTSANFSVSITSNGGDWISSRGVCWSTNLNPTIDLATKTSNGTGNEPFTGSITGLLSATTYHVRAYATNTTGTAYGSDFTFSTLVAGTPSVTTTSISSITGTSAVCGGNATSDGGNTITARGVCWSANPNPTIDNSKTSNGTGTGAFSGSITGLTENNIYHVRAYATNSIATAYGADIAFTAIVGGTPVIDNDNMMLGNPSSATYDIVNANNYLMVKPQYCLSYNNSKLTTNWTSWHLYSGDIGSSDRQNDFRADVTLPSGWTQIGSSDYQFSTYGFDRGHMCPSADRTSSVANNSATFLMTNMIPQAPNNNQGPWAKLEDYGRTLIDAGNELYIISGPYGEGGTSNGANGTSTLQTFTKLGSGVVVPSYTWKIIVVVPNGDIDISRITTATRVIAIWMPNSNTACPRASLWSSYKVSVDYIESQTGYNFLSNVSTSIQDVIEARVDAGK